MKEERARTKQKRTQVDILKQWQRFGTILQDMLNINKKAYTQRLAEQDFITDMIKNKIHWGVRRLSPYYSPVFPSLPGPLQ